VATKLGGSIGLRINSALPSKIIFPPPCERYAEMRSIGMWGRFERIWATSSQPLSLGINRSVMTRSTWHSFSKDSAWSPSAAWMTWWPSIRSASANALRVMASSSTRRITALLYSAEAYEKQGVFWPVVTAGLIPRSLLRKELLPDLLESVIPECFYRESRRDRNWTPD
jgi:hypothetical protein